jgi:type I site-specific restriction endonuclease
MEDGYLAAMDIKLALVDLDARGLTLAEIIHRNPTDATTGRRLSPREIAERYDANIFEKNILLPDRVAAMCRDLFEQMLGNAIHRGPDGTPLGPRQKTIIFCASDRHADFARLKRGRASNHLNGRLATASGAFSKSAPFRGADSKRIRTKPCPPDLFQSRTSLSVAATCSSPATTRNSSPGR